MTEYSVEVVVELMDLFMVLLFQVWKVLETILREGSLQNHSWHLLRFVFNRKSGSHLESAWGFRCISTSVELR